MTLFLAAMAAAATALASPPPLKSVRILQLNIYGRAKQSCEERYRAIADHVLKARPAYDIVSFNEHWNVGFGLTCDHKVLTDAMRADGRYKAANLGYPRTHDSIADGGNSLFTLHTISDFHEGYFVNARTDLASGYMLNRVELGGAVGLDVWTVHAEAASDGCDPFCRLEQLTDFASSVELMSGVGDHVKYPVLIAGDLNLGGPMHFLDRPPYAGNEGYADLMDVFKNPRDLWLEANPLSLFPGYTYDCALNNLVSCKYRERIDYILNPTDKRFGESAYRLAVKSVSIVRWKTPGGLDVSDHFGLDATLEIRKR